jgi:hypothetical protein
MKRSKPYTRSPHRKRSSIQTVLSLRPSKATIIERRLSISVGSRTGTMDLVLPPEVLPAELVLDSSGGVVDVCGGDGGGSSLHVHVQPGRQYACGAVVVGADVCSVGEGQEKNRAANGRAYGTMIDIGNGDGLASMSRFQTSASKAS